MRVLLDANIYISYLLSPASDTPPMVVVEAAFTGAYTLLATAGVIAELRDKTATKPYLANRITQTQAERLVAIIATIAESVPEVDEPLPEVGGDRKDDYLYAHALVGRADYLVSGDKGVLQVRQIGAVQLLSPFEFLQVLRQADLG